MSAPVFGITGWKNSGKTTLTERLVAEFTRRGLKVSTVKHAHHGFDTDQPGTDSHRHRQAGAREVAIVSARRWAIVHETGADEAEASLAETLSRLSPCDLVLIEGYKSEVHAKIECRREAGARGGPLAAADPAIVAIAADHDTDAGGLPVFDLGDIAGIADFIAAHVKLEGGRARQAS